MFGSTVLEVAIGLVFVYLLVSVICSALNELLASAINKRGHNLFEGVKNLLNDPGFTGLAQQLYSHGLIHGITQHPSDPHRLGRRPSYIPASNFSLALLDIVTTQGVVAAAHGATLAAAERADDAYEEARAAESAAPTDAGRTAATQAAAAERDRAWTVLQQSADQAAQFANAAEAEASAAGADQTVRDRAAAARAAADAAHAAVKLIEARRAAVASARSPKDAALLRTSSRALEEALEAGRRLSAAYPDPIGMLTAGLERLPAGHTRESLLVLLAKTQREARATHHAVDVFRANVETWFNDAMARVSGWYKRWTQVVLLVVALVVVSVANADTIAIVRRLASDTVLRAALANAATAAVASGPTASQPVSPPASPEGAAYDPARDARVGAVLNQARALELPIGWSVSTDPNDIRRVPRTLDEFVLKALGLLLSISAVSLGAPFWFDTLSRVANIRGAGTPPGEPKKNA